MFKLLKLYEDFGWEVLVFGYLLFFCNLDKLKLLKCKNLILINYYKEMGYLLEVLLNYLGCMGWLMLDECEKFILDEMIEYFDMKCVLFGGFIFDIDKFSWLNGMWICENLFDVELM